MTMHISRRLANGIALLNVNGPLIEGVTDVDGGGLRTTVAQLADTGFAEIALNLRGITQLDARGLGELVVALRAARDRGTRLTLVAPPPRVQRMLSITRLDTVFELYEGEAELRARRGAALAQRRGTGDAQAAYA